ncbi:MAG: ATP-binding cassette domain-containing protein, partial [Oleiphilaceae bacterium]|nr:ATP-binding cassette domain-containing protein [Oleiphilaceae bacterium]
MQKLMRLRLRDISKSFGNCLANDRVSLSIAAGEIHAVLGENGAGKSTLMKIIYGVEQADSGSLLWQGEPLHNHHPSRARELGIGMVFQHFTLFETLTVAENIALSLPPGDASDRKLLAQKIRDVSRRYGMALEPDRYVHTLSVGEQQRVEIVRCLLQHVQLLILDEPTSVLTPQEVATLFTALRQLAAEGCSILFISHKLEEVRSLCERATILRNGQVSGECALAEMSTKDIARMMVGEATSLNEHYPSGQAGKEMLRLDAVTTNSRHPFSVNLSSLSFAVDRGQILGIAGVAGNGQSELMRLLNGELVASKGKIWLDDKEITPLSVAARRQQGLAYIPEDRLGRGAVPNMDLFDNAMLTAHHRGLHRRGW